MEPLYSHQLAALKNMHDGCILCGGVGSGKSRTALAYYHLSCGGKLKIDGKGDFALPTNPRPLYVITTAKKRDSLDWQQEALLFGITNVVVDSWNNIAKYRKVYSAFFIFDEQRVVGKGKWVKVFIDISRKNRWILLSATPGDNWEDYIPVFIANRFYRNRTEFLAMHAIYSRFAKYPKIEEFRDEDVLEEFRDRILVTMPYENKNVLHHIDIKCDYSRAAFLKVWRDRWDVYKDEPIAEPSALFYCMRRVVNSDKSRIREIDARLEKHSKALIFYNFDYELEILRSYCENKDIAYGEWNGHNHTDIPQGDRWLYLVNYAAGSEGWNCITCDTIFFYSQNYSYKTMVQAAGRIDRNNTPFEHLYFYHLKSHAPIDVAIAKALKNKKKFNEKAYLNSRRITRI